MEAAARRSSSPPPLAADAGDVTFCAVQRVAGQLFVCVATAAPGGWSVHRVGRFGAAPVQVAVDSAKDGALVANVRFFRLFELPRNSRDAAAAVGALFVSERCKEVSYPRLEEQRHVEEDDEAAMLDFHDGDASEDLTVFSLADERILKKLPPSPSLVLDVQVNASTAAVLCESNEIRLYDISTWELVRSIATTAPAMALGPRWIAYPGFVPDRESLDGSDADELVPEALVGATHYAASKLEAPSYTAIDVAQNVASGLYYLSEIGRATIAPYLSSSPSASAASTASNSATPVGSFGYPSVSPFGSATDKPVAKRNSLSAGGASTAAHAGWAVVQDVVTERVVGNFKCHSTALVTLAFDFAGLLLATCSTKGQNLHVYRLLPPLQVTHGRRRDGHQLLYKLQRGITHASIQDVAFSQDAKWISVTSAHGTSHLYAIHPDGARINSETHANAAEEAPAHRAPSDSALAREVDDFYAEFRALETKTLAQVLKIRHAMPAAVLPSSSAASALASSGAAQASPPVAFLVESALDASQAFFSHLAHSTSLSMDFGYHHGDDNDVDARRRRRRRRISCLFSHDDAKLLVCCDRSLKLLDVKVQPSAALSGGGGAESHVAVAPVAPVANSRTKCSSSSASAFGFDASVTELKTWELKTASRSGDADARGDRVSVVSKRNSRKSELRTFAQRTLPLWAHPKVTFRAVDAEHPGGRVLEAKRKGPNPNADAGGDEHMFVLEMDAYFGVGGSPVFHGQAECPVAPEVPPLDLRQSINLAMATSLASPAQKAADTSPAFADAATAVGGKRKKKKNGRVAAAPADGDGLGAALQFTLQDMYFALPKDARG